MNITAFWAKMITNPLPDEFFAEPIGPRSARSPKKRGRTEKSFETKGKTQKTEEVNKVMDTSSSLSAHITASGRMCGNDGFKSAASLLKRLAKDPEVIAEKLLKAEKDTKNMPEEVPVDKALFHLLLTNKSKSAYIMDKQINDRHKSKIWPHYGKIAELKKELLSFGGMTFSEDGKWATSDMQTCLNNQMTRLITGKLKAKMRAIKRKEPNIKFVLDFKVGADGSSSHSEYQHANKGIF